MTIGAAKCRPLALCLPAAAGALVGPLMILIGIVWILQGLNLA
jgi:hypothetical protein